MPPRNADPSILPTELTHEQIRDILARGAIREFVGRLENEFLEFKGEPYHLDDDLQKLELAKDVSAFSNTLGGVIVIGVKTTKVPEYNADVAQELKPIRKDLFRGEQCEGIVRDWVYPSLNDFRVDFIPSDDDADKGFFVLNIPASAAAHKPFLIVKGTDDNKRKDRRITFGYAERFRASSLPVMVQRLQQLLHLGIRFESHESAQRGLDNRLDDIGTRMERLETIMLRQVQTDDLALQAQRENRFGQDVEQTIREVVMNDRPRLILGAIPVQSLTLPSLFASSEDALVNAFEHPPELRPAGFDLGLERPSEILQGSSRRVSIPGYKAIQLSVDGELIILAVGDEDFLAWAMNSHPGQPIRINSFVLAEVVYIFALYVKSIYEFGMPRPTSIKLYIGLQNMARDGKPAILTSARVGPYVSHSEWTDRKAPSSNCLQSVEVAFNETAERTSFLLRAQLYHWFGFDDSNIPYTETLDSGMVITKLFEVPVKDN
jgi:hypothetical protein